MVGIILNCVYNNVIFLSCTDSVKLGILKRGLNFINRRLISFLWGSREERGGIRRGLRGFF